MHDLTLQEYRQWIRERGEQELREILFWRWDPIGVSDAFPITRDEYDSYVLMLIGSLREGSKVEQIVSLLLGFEGKEMGGPYSTPEKLEQVAELIVQWYPESIECWNQRQDEK